MNGRDDPRITNWGVPKGSRLDTAKETALRMRDERFRAGVPTNDEGEHNIIIADSEDRMSEVLDRYYKAGSPVTFSVRVGERGLVPVKMYESTDVLLHAINPADTEDQQVCSPEASFGMLISLLLKREGRPIRIHLEEPATTGYQLEFA